ncbi:metalloendopeptidase [Neophaeococcomyces mojaviensis]|uniref:Metalloendopeptidase n=1 Tax=Neophaeococcomyces mojaviensis TaxID=3383035 RepID=A0ACC2ZXU9_9EURO|nr:metalloendopeptidase [Knufia sp. JES_112]
MNFLRTGLRISFRGLPRSSSFTARLPRFQQRFASYQRFPGRGGGSGPSFKPYSNFGPYARVQYIWRNYQKPVLVVGAGGTTFYVFNLEEVPITHRRRFNFISPETEKSLVSDREYQSLLQQFRGKVLPREHPYTQLVAKIVERLLPSAHGLDGGDWKVHVIDDPNMVNAFVMPGGKVFVFTGIMPVAQDENGLAAVIGHEIGHNVAHHVGERLSRQFFTIAAAFLVSTLFDVSGQFGSSVTDLILTLPNGRTQETEADHIGLLMMAESCYDPRRAPELWKRMAENERKHGGAPPQFLSTHPSSGTRGETMQKWMPAAMAKYDESDCSITGHAMDEFRRLTDIGRSVRRSAPIPIFTGGSNSSDDDWF